MTELWKDIAGYGGMYEVSNFGRVRSKDRTRLVKNRYGTENYRTDKGKELAQIEHGDGYLYVSINLNGKRQNHYIHRLVADAFCERRSQDYVVNHKDYDKSNNHADNLEWCTQGDNIRYSACRMKKPHKPWKQTASGEKYIYLRNGRYRLHIRGKVDKTYPTLESALMAREVVLSGEKYLAG